MPIKVLSSGAMVTVDAEDYDLVDGPSWHIYRIRPSMRTTVARTETRHGRMFRVYLHREIAIRMNPDLLRRKYRVLPINGDYLDCRRENLRFIVQKRTCGRLGTEPRPKGWQRRKVSGKRQSPPASPTWAGGYVYVPLWRVRKGEGYRLRKCINDRDIVD